MILPLNYKQFELWRLKTYKGKFIDKIKGMGFRGFLSILHLVFGVWLVITALSILAKPQIFPWWILDINIVSSGILLMVGLTSLLIFLNFIKSAKFQAFQAYLLFSANLLGKRKPGSSGQLC